MTKENLEIQIKRIKGTHSMRLKIGRDGMPVLHLPYWIPMQSSGPRELFRIFCSNGQSQEYSLRMVG